jgi:hypothetical protein
MVENGGIEDMGVKMVMSVTVVNFRLLPMMHFVVLDLELKVNLKLE